MALKYLMLLRNEVLAKNPDFVPKLLDLATWKTTYVTKVEYYFNPAPTKPSRTTKWYLLTQTPNQTAKILSCGFLICSYVLIIWLKTPFSLILHVGLQETQRTRRRKKIYIIDPVQLTLVKSEMDIYDNAGAD